MKKMGVTYLDICYLNMPYYALAKKVNGCLFVAISKEIKDTEKEKQILERVEEDCENELLVVNI